MTRRLPSPEQYKTLQDWARNFVDSINREFEDPAGFFNSPRPILLAHQVNTGNLGLARAGTGGVLMHEPVSNRPVYSDGTEWIPLANVPDIEDLQDQIDDITAQTVLAGTTAIAATPAGVLIPFGVTFGATPHVTATYNGSVTDTTTYVATVHSITTTGFTVQLRVVGGFYSTPVQVASGTICWIAVGAT